MSRHILPQYRFYVPSRERYPEYLLASNCGLATKCASCYSSAKNCMGLGRYEDGVSGVMQKYSLFPLMLFTTHVTLQPCFHVAILLLRFYVFIPRKRFLEPCYVDTCTCKNKVSRVIAKESFIFEEEGRSEFLEHLVLM